MAQTRIVQHNIGLFPSVNVGIAFGEAIVKYDKTKSIDALELRQIVKEKFSQDYIAKAMDEKSELNAVLHGLIQITNSMGHELNVVKLNTTIAPMDLLKEIKEKLPKIQEQIAEQQQQSKKNLAKQAEDFKQQLAEKDKQLKQKEATIKEKDTKIDTLTKQNQQKEAQIDSLRKETQKLKQEKLALEKMEVAYKGLIGKDGKNINNIARVLVRTELVVNNGENNTSKGVKNGHADNDQIKKVLKTLEESKVIPSGTTLFGAFTTLKATMGVVFHDDAMLKFVEALKEVPDIQSEMTRVREDEMCKYNRSKIDAIQNANAGNFRSTTKHFNMATNILKTPAQNGKGAQNQNRENSNSRLGQVESN